MADRPQHPSPVDLEALVRDALLHLYDATYLQTHPLAHLPAMAADRHNPALRSKRLLQALLDGIESLQPPRGTAASSRAWRSYQVLNLRYAEALDARSVMGQLAISKAQYQREHARALAALTSLLRDRWGLPEAPGPGEDPVEEPPEAPESLALREASDLFAHMQPETLDLREVLGAILTTLEPITRGRQVSVRLGEGHAVDPVYADRVATRRILLSLLHRAIAAGEDGVLEIEFATRERRSEIAIRAQAGPGAQPSNEQSPTEPESEFIDRFVAALAGTLSIDQEPRSGVWSARLSLPVARRPLLLVVDNNPDFVLLVKRFLLGQGWQVVGAGSVEEARARMLESRPAVVLLDVMLPGEDGWDFLLSLRKDPTTQGTTVIVCSVLSEPLVAESLGAVAYLPKPVNQAALLGALAPYA